MIDPRIWDSEQVMKLTSDGFKLYVYLISQSDDEGKLTVSYQLFLSRVFPFGGPTVQDIESMVKEMDKTGLIILYCVDGKHFIRHPNWTRYQKIDRATKSSIPDPLPIVEGSSRARRGLVRNRIEVKGIEKKGIENSAAVAAIVKDTPFYHRIQEGFLKRNGDKFTDYGKEGKAIHGLMEKAQARDANNAEDLLVSVCAAFWKLKTSGDKFWSSQPFLPSALNSSSIWDRVLESMRVDEVDPEILAIIKAAPR
jgi:hypothetical protein